MRRMTASISLTLISSSLILAGCARKPPPKDDDKDQDQVNGQPVHHHSTWVPHHYWWFSPGYHWGGYSYRPSAPAGRSGTRGVAHSGGFGSSGHAAGA